MSDLWRVTTTFTGPSGMPGTNTIHSNTEAISDPADFLDIVQSFWGRLASGFGSGSSGLTSSLTITTTGLFEVIDSENGHIIDTADAGDDVVHVGNGTGEPLPHFTQGLVSFPTGSYFGGRQLRGKLYIPGLTEDQSTNGAPASAWVAQVKTEADLLVESGMVIYSPTHREFARTGNPVVWNQFAVLRSRRD